MSSTSRGGVRSELDFYETQPEDSRPEIERLKAFFVGRSPRRILEPMAGRGSLVREMRLAWPEAEIVAVELDPGRAELLEAAGASQVVNADLFSLSNAFFEDFDLALTNPAFVCAEQCVEVLRKHIPHVVILQRANFLASLDRAAFWDAHPADFRMLRKRPGFAASLQCGRTDAKGKKDSCGWKAIQFLDSPRPKDCPGTFEGSKCQAKVLCSTTDSCEYCWYHFFAESTRQYGFVGRGVTVSEVGAYKATTEQGALFA